MADETDETVFDESSSDEDDAEYVPERVRRKKKEKWLDSDEDESDDSDTEPGRHFLSAASGKKNLIVCLLYFRFFANFFETFY